MSKNCLRNLLLAGVTLSALVTGGCGRNASQSPTEKAEKVLERFLDAWSRGESADKFADPNNAIQGTDPDWKAGYRLLSFLSADAREKQDQPDHVLCRVSLYLQDKQGRKQEKKVEYDVRLGEKNVINRAAR